MLRSICELQVREEVHEAVLIGFQTDPDYIRRSLATLNSEAVAQCKAGDHVAAVVAFCKLFERAKRKNLIHPEMHVCHRYLSPRIASSRVSTLHTLPFGRCTAQVYTLTWHRTPSRHTERLRHIFIPCNSGGGWPFPCSCSNRAAAYLALGMWDEALKDAERARMLAQDALKKTHAAVPPYIKTFAQKGEALIGEP